MQSMASDTASETASGRLQRLRASRLRVGAAIAVGLAAALLVWLAVGRGTDDSPSGSGSASSGELEPSLMSAEELHDLAASTSVPLYWAGPRAGARYEVTRTRAGTVYLRYLPPALRVGDLEPALTVVTYPIENALERMQANAGKRSSRIPLPDGGLAVVDPSRPTNVHFAYPGQAVQVEVYAPSPGLARRLVLSGVVRPL
jgi:hypothetical protein